MRLGWLLPAALLATPPPSREERLSCSIRGFYPFPQGVKGPLAWLFRDTHQAISVTTSDGDGGLLLDFMTEGGMAHPVWWDETEKWRVLLGGSIAGEVRVRETGTWDYNNDTPDQLGGSSKLRRLRAAALAYDDRMNLYSNNCRVFCARMEREVARLNAEEEEDDERREEGLAEGAASERPRRRADDDAAADARLALALLRAGVLPLLYPAAILWICWTGLDGIV